MTLRLLLILTALLLGTTARPTPGATAPRAEGGAAVAGEPDPVSGATLTIGSKKFTESVILGEMLTQLAREAGYTARHDAELGGTRILFTALTTGDIDAYPDYTGTLRLEIFANQQPETAADVERLLDELGLAMSEPLGFNNTYALAMTRDRAAELGIETIDDLREHPSLTLGFNHEFLDRADGWPALRQAYNLPQTRVQGMDHDIAYRALAAGSIDLMEVYSTDAEIAYYDLLVLEDTRDFFDRYDAVILYRQDLAERFPRLIPLIDSLAGTLDEAAMQRLNSAAKIEGLDEAAVASAFLEQQFGLDTTYTVYTRFERVLRRTREHLVLVGVSMGVAVLIALPLGVLAARLPRTGQGILGLVGVIQTIPSLALLALLVAVSFAGLRLGTGAPPAIVALILYSLLPMVRNTHAGLVGIPANLRESAEALGLSRGAILRQVELPLASRSILAGIKTAVVINIGFATLGALVGAGGYGQPILTGIRRDDVATIMEGVIPAAALAIAAQLIFELLERVLTPRTTRA